MSRREHGISLIEMNAGRRFHLAGRAGELVRCGLSWSMVALIFVVHGVVELSADRDRWFATFGLDREGISRGEIWRVVTYGLFHGSWIHLLVNAMCLLMLGARLEATVGRRMLGATLASGVTLGGLLHLLLVPTDQAGPVLLVGISGGCMALLLLLTTLSPESRMWPLPLSGRSLGWGILSAALLLALVNPALGVPGLAAAGEFLERRGMGDWFKIGHACHAGGGIAGYLAGRWVLRPRVSLARLQRDRSRREGEAP